MRITVCKDCKDRSLGCHDHCERYRNQKESEQQALDKYKADNRGNIQLRQIYSECKVKKMRRYKEDLW